MVVLGVKVWRRSLLPDGRCVFSVCLLPRGGMAQPPFTAPPDPPQDMIPQDMILLGRGEDRSSQAQIHAVWSWHFPMWELKPLLTTLSFSL